MKNLAQLLHSGECAVPQRAATAHFLALLAAFNAERGLNLDAQTARCKWGGERMDYNIAINGLCRQAGYT